MRRHPDFYDSADYRFWWWDDAVAEAILRAEASGVRMRVFLDRSPWSGRMLWTVRAVAA